jgi:hypothetical protein
MNPYRDDPPARPVEDSMKEIVVNSLEVCDEPMDTNLTGPDSVCSCGECPIMQRSEEQKCCAEVPDWREEYHHTGHWKSVQLRCDLTPRMCSAPAKFPEYLQS